MSAAEALVRAFYEEWNAGKHPATLVEAGFAETARWNTQPELPDPGTYAGREAITRFLTGLRESVPFRNEIEELDEPSPGVVITRLRLVGAGQGSGIPVDTIVFHVHRVERGTITEVRAFFERDDARAAAEELAESGPRR